jgi:hypothetical protein
MALCWNIPSSKLDGDLAWSPERYSADRFGRVGRPEASVLLSQLVRLEKGTFAPTKAPKTEGTYCVLDTNHAYEGRIQFRGNPVAASEIGSVKRPIRHGNVIISRLRTYLRQVAYVDHDFTNDFEGRVLCSTEFYVLAALDSDDISYLVPFLLTSHPQQIFLNSQEGGHHPRMPYSTLLGLSIPREIFERRQEIGERFRNALRMIRASEEIQSHIAEDCQKFG